VVRAAGGVVVRGAGDDREIVLVHRPKYDDWTLPKGKVEPGETDEDCALREVEEETGLVCELGEELPTVRYHDAAGRPKTVRYWRMHPIDDRLAPTKEIDEARWVTLAEADELLDYERDHTVLRGLT
jgi:8-oxo-dGTP diphosphatase